MMPEPAGHDRSPLATVRVPCPACAADEPQPWARGRDFEYDTSEAEFEFVRCGGCSVLYLCPRPADEELERIYPPDYAPYHFDRPGLTLAVRRWLEARSVREFRRLLPERAEVLDAGCGGPGFLERLRLHGGPGWRLCGNDVAPGVLAELGQRGFAALPGRFEALSGPAESFDAIFLKQVIEHVASPPAALATATRLLRPGGLLVLETPNTDAWDARLFRRRYWGGYHFPRHWTLFDASTLAALAERAGLRVEGARYLLSPSFWMQALHHALQDRGWPRAVYDRIHHRNSFVMGAASLLDVAQLLLTGRTSNLRLLLRRPPAPGQRA